MDWEEIFNLRKHFHEHPELSFKEFQTTETIAATLQKWGIPFNHFENLETGGWADVGEGETLYAFRSDIDALPIEEDTKHAVKSKNAGIMHACGHDYHTTIGLGLLKYFKDHPQELNGKLRVIFQPAEEAAPGGAEKVAGEDIWQDVQGILTVHVQPQTPTGTFVLFDGPVQASSTSLFIRLKGPGGHTSKPNETIDLINVGSQYVVQLQSYLKQRIDSRDAIAFAFGSVHAGETHNIIPQELTLRGTLRTLDNAVLSACLETIKSFSQKFGALYDVSVDVQFPTNCPATVNDHWLSAKFLEFVQTQRNDLHLLQPKKPSMGADDFSFYLQKVPGLYLLIGGGGKGVLHSPHLELDERLLKFGIETLVEFISFLMRQNRTDPNK